MSIKSDNWIRRMALDHKMIEPFAAQQVRQSNGHKIVSYGTSSYGYDVRCANEFKIFTNINSSIVDPKNFDEKSFVDFGGDVCIIPPNSFALARTVEYFRIPRSVLTICLGKCVTGDTRVVDATTGAYVPITEMRFGKSTLALDGWSLKPARVSAFVPQGKRPVFQLRTRSGLRIRATANHPFRMLQGWVPLKDLRAGDRIAVARSIPVFGKTPIANWEASLLGLMISQGQCYTPGHSPAFTSADPVLVKLLEDSVAASGLGLVTYPGEGTCGYRLVNHPERGGVPQANQAHAWLVNHGLNVGAGEKFVPQMIFTAPQRSVRLFLQALFGGGGLCHQAGKPAHLEYHSQSRRLIEDVHHLLLRFGIFSLIRDKTTASGTQACSIQITDRVQIARFAAEIGFAPGCIKQVRLEEEFMPVVRANLRRHTNLDTLPEQAWALLTTAAHPASVSCKSPDIHADRTPSARHGAAARLATATYDPVPTALMDGPLWEVVESIEDAGTQEVFDICVPRHHNFVANDLIIHNSTYARCFSGNTRVALADGSALTLEDMARRHDAGEAFRGYSIGADGQLIVAQLQAPRFIGRDALFEVQLDSGARIAATPDHRFLKRDGKLVAAGALRAADALMPLYREGAPLAGQVYDPADGRMRSMQQLLGEWNRRRGLAQPPHPVARGAGSGHAAYRNHRVVAVRELPGDHDVYCLTVPEAGNFALEAGVFVKNCGIIVNVTPLEPEWEGHVTLEFSNTTTLPAKIYANEGVAQMLFFESDEVCSTSYKDRGGKYQGQLGVTLPKT